MLGNLLGRVSGQLNTFTCKSEGLVNVWIFLGGSLTNQTISHVSLWKSISRFKYFSQ
jgi:hypothetical protein